MKLTVTFDVDEDVQTYDYGLEEDVPVVDHDHPMGVTEAGYLAMVNTLADNFGAENVEIHKAD